MSLTTQQAELDKAFEALKTYTTGVDVKTLAALDLAVSDAQNNPAASAALEQRLIGALASSYPNEARAYAARKLAVIGTNASVAAVVPLLNDDELSVFARNVLERVPGPESAQALRNALATTTGRNRIGVINSLGARRDAESIPMLTRLLAGEADAAAAAAKALGEIGTPEAAKALASARVPADGVVQLALADGLLIAADRLLAAGHRDQAIQLLERLSGSSQPEHIRSAAARTLSAARRR